MGNAQGTQNSGSEVMSAVFTAIVAAFKRETQNKGGNPPPQFPPRIKDVYRIDTMIAKSSNYTYGDDWFDALIKWFDILAPKGARVIVITGTHGSPQGKLSLIEKFQGVTINAAEFVPEDAALIAKIKIAKKKEIDDRGIVFEIVNVFDPLYTNKNKTVNPDKLGKRISDLQPSAVILGFCFSEMSEINGIMERAGVTTNLFIHQYRMQITGKRS